MNAQKIKIIIGLMMATFLAALEGTIVTLAIPTIVKDLQGFELISFVFSVYLLTSALSTPVYGKLSDLYGRKNILAIGIAIFLLGSIFCGLSRSMGMLIAFRALQGLGAGAIYTVSFTIIGDVFPLKERSIVQGSLSTVWGIASLVGPFLGGFIIDMLSWHWIFFINIPFGLISIFLLQRALQESFERKKISIDYAGTLCLSLAMTVFLSIFLFSPSGPIRYVYIPCSLVITMVLLFVFYRIERKAREPLVPFELFTRTSIYVNLLSFFISAVLIGVSVYLPIYLQNILGLRAMISGLAIMPMSLSWLIVSFLLGRFLVNYGGKNVTLLSAAVLVLSTALLLTLGPNSSVGWVLLYCFIFGIAFSGTLTTLTIIVQDSVGYLQRGAAVAVNSLLRALGQTIGIAVFGGIFNASITNYFVRLGIAGVDPSNLYESALQQQGVSVMHIKLSLSASMQILFLIFTLLACLTLLLSCFMPKNLSKI